MLADQRFELPDDGRVITERQSGFDAVLDRHNAEIVEPHSLSLRELFGRKLGQRRPPPQRQRIIQELHCRRCVITTHRRLRLTDQALEAHRVELHRINRKQITRRIRQQDRWLVAWTAVGLEDLAQPRDIHVHCRRGARWRIVSPEAYDDAVARHPPVCLDEQHGQQSTRLGSAERYRHAVFEHVERAEYPELHASLRSHGAAVAEPDLANFQRGRRAPGSGDDLIDQLLNWGGASTAQHLTRTRPSREVPNVA
jgi:hypothetical protein